MSPFPPSKCPNCNYQSSRSRRKCPMCGYATPRHWAVDVALLVVVALVIAGVIKLFFLR